jgi:hypothetical protein
MGHLTLVPACAGTMKADQGETAQMDQVAVSVSFSLSIA